jgi:hypothetical protein
MPAIENDPLPLDGGNSGLPMFMVTMLRLARILTAKEQERSEISTSQLSRFMHYYRVHLPLTYTSKAIVEQLFSYGGEIAGAGVKVSWQEIMPQEGRKMPRYQFTISRDYEPDRTTTE